MQKNHYFFLVIFSILIIFFFSSCFSQNPPEKTFDPAVVETSSELYIQLSATATTTTAIATSEKMHGVRDDIENAASKILLQGAPLNDSRPVIRWNKPIKVRIRGSVGDKEEEMVQNLVNRVSAIDGVPEISFAKKKEEANFLIAFGTRDYLASHYVNIPPSYSFRYNCILSTNNNKSIDRTSLYIAKLDDALLYNKRTTRAFMEGLGVGKYDISIFEIEDTVFNPNVKTYYFSQFDSLLIKTLYSSNFVPGKYKEEMVSQIYDYLDRAYIFFTTTTTTQPTTFVPIPFSVGE